jgi:uncharacterized membrane protein
MGSTEETLKDIVTRLERIESRLGLTPAEDALVLANDVETAKTERENNPFMTQVQSDGSETFPEESSAPSPASFEVPSVARVLGIGGSLALVSAGVYIIKLCIDSGWLTPERQVILVGLAGLALLFSSFFFPKIDQKYATSISVCGLILNYLAIGGAAEYYHIIGPGMAMAFIMAVTVLGLYVSQALNAVMLAYIGALAIYSAPLSYEKAFSSDFNMALFCLLWGVIFCVQATMLKRRSVYLAALYLGLWNFHMSQEGNPSDAVVFFQFAQLIIFGLGMLGFSFRHKTAMTRGETYAHLPALVLYYILQADVARSIRPGYEFLLPALSIVIVFMFFRLAERLLKGQSEAGALMVSTLAGILVFHAYNAAPGITDQIQCYAGLCILPVLALAHSAKFPFKKFWPLPVALGLIALNAAPFALISERVPSWVPLVYAAEIYAAFVALRQVPQRQSAMLLVLYIGHIYAMVALYEAINHEIKTSVVWGLLAVGWFVYAKFIKSPKVAQAALILYSAAGFKLIVLDLGDSEPVVKIFALITVGAAFFLGGWIYQRIVREQTAKTDVVA